MSGAQTNQRIDGRRLWDSLMEMAEIGATPKGGVKRLALGPVDKAGRDRFRTLCEAAGLAVRVDAMGNMFARRAGRDAGRRPVLFGSHLDSQPTGGKFDGALGVMAGLEVMRSLDDLGIVTEAPVELVNWTDEEGSRFGKSLMGSGVWAGVYDQAETEALCDLEGVSVGASLDAIGYRGAEPARPFPADAYFELHIEQGPILEREGKQIGVVTGGQAQVWYDVVATGQDSHAGTTPPSTRRDALVCAARVDRPGGPDDAGARRGRAGDGGAAWWCCRTAGTWCRGRCGSAWSSGTRMRRRSGVWRRSSRGRPGSSRGIAGWS